MYGLKYFVTVVFMSLLDFKHVCLWHLAQLASSGRRKQTDSNSDQQRVLQLVRTKQTRPTQDTGGLSRR